MTNITFVECSQTEWQCRWRNYTQRNRPLV